MNVAERIRAEYQRRSQSGGPDLDYLKSLTDADIRDYLHLEDQENRTNGDRIVWAAERMDQRRVLSVISSFTACESQNEPLSAQAAFLYYACAKKLPMPPNLVAEYLERIKAFSPSHLAQLHGQIAALDKPSGQQ